jgi:dienelactone hydrolase
MNRALSLVSRLVACVATCTMSVTGCAGAPPVTAPASAQAAPSPARSAHPVRSEIVPYSEGATPLEGYLAIPADSAAGARLPALLVFHDWMGLGEGTKRRADQLAALGYVAFAADVYGAGVHPANAGEAGKLAGKFKEDRALLRARGAAALKALAASAHADPTRVVAMGYCFGGTAALELGRSGAAVEDARNIKGRVLALHGADDPFVKAEEVLAFEDEMRQAGVDWQLKAYGGAVHAFTVKEAGSDPKKGAAYDARADARSWAELQLFLGELFPR